MSTDPGTTARKPARMAEAAPFNDLGQFRLGKEHLRAGQHTQAATALARAVALNPKLAEAYLVCGEAYEKASQVDKAIDMLRRGVDVADAGGDERLRDKMIARLRSLGDDYVLGSPAAFTCKRCGSSSARLNRPPIKGPLGTRIMSTTCGSCWKAWVAEGTRVINEMGLVLADPKSQDAYDRCMLEFLGLSESSSG